MKKKPEIGLIILAAGASERMGNPKQLLEFQGRTFLKHAVQTALDSKCRRIAVVLGANSETLINELTGLDVEIVHNPKWPEGMSGSIRAGLKRLLEVNNRLRAVVIMVCDQPFVTTEVIDELIVRYVETNSLIVASEYARTLGVPALFDKELFSALRNLQEKVGAKHLIRQFSAQTVSVFFPAGEFDIDTPEDYALLGESVESVELVGKV